MTRTYISELSNLKDGDKVTLNGWVAAVKDLSKVKFVILRDRTGEIQTVAVNGKTPEETFNNITKIPHESAISITGSLKESKIAKAGYEVVIDNFEILNKAETPLPIDTTPKSNTNIDKRIDYRFLDARRPKVRAIFNIRSTMVRAITEFFDNEGFTNITTPKLTAAGVESGAEMFEVKYFNKNAFLSQSPQIYKQMMVAAGFEKVYEIGPVFRAEKSHTTRHLTEFTGLDMEMGFIKDVGDVMDVIEDLFKYTLNYIKENCKSDLELLEIEVNIPKEIPRISMKEAKDLLKKEGKTLKESDDLDSEAEELLGKLMLKQHNSEFVFVTDYPWEVRPFYHMKPEDNPKGTCSFDLIWNGVEIATGAQREHRYDILKQQADEKGINLDEMKEYSDLFKFGCPPHGGIGLGLDRMVQRLLKLNNVREAILLPRDPERLTP
ncbi:aspartate--tRNA(Asn) ligase [Candidatus Woesearchaeota archaeon]|jgi:aspartyl-tRNA synthetase|nr:aspartate--tRNA(Asn) ligase [Candidatus Woesearchaeota archaeon]MBT3438398.1 aspartate--tRNA(Asn) ligase [Candidatus Woesearchaeota archaeon]MBT4058268.1 aspartate--tRNA(Asn) ligase [Candidatus Woesearchaeota archaeon]MBT4209239.1 aspartate--tRNA(Asn) ligase [Candidatus Woesearchaeota archaeon]MBT4732181.1 aspartate--tRNA(Asn) ligase [Candidatus Woesearchaeota archaeon]